MGRRDGHKNPLRPYCPAPFFRSGQGKEGSFFFDFIFLKLLMVAWLVITWVVMMMNCTF